MKKILALILILFLVGCTTQVIEVEPDDVDTTDDTTTETTDTTTDDTTDDTTDTTTETEDTAETTNTTEETAETTAVGEHIVEIKEYALDPKTITIKVGDTVTWKNVKPEDKRNSKAQIWRVRGVCSSDIKSEYFMPGETYSYTFDDVEPGECHYREILQGDYAGKIVIE